MTWPYRWGRYAVTPLLAVLLLADWRASGLLIGRSQLVLGAALLATGSVALVWALGFWLAVVNRHYAVEATAEPVAYQRLVHHGLELVGVFGGGALLWGYSGIGCISLALTLIGVAGLIWRTR